MSAQPTHPNAAALAQFYEALGRHDAEGMVAHYDRDATFSDPVFVSLKGEELFGMWRMLTRRAKDLRVEASAIEADDQSGRAHWDAYYTFSKTGRDVVNRIDARFVFRGGKIVEHHDSFNFWAWAGMALGPKGRFLGWLPAVKRAVRTEADKNLRSFLASNRP